MGQKLIQLEIAGQTLTTSTPKVLDFGDLIVKTGTWTYDTNSITIPEDGYYRVQGVVKLVGSVDNAPVYTRVRRDGTSVEWVLFSNSGAWDLSQNFSNVRVYTAGQVIDVETEQQSGGNRDTATPQTGFPYRESFISVELLIPGQTGELTTNEYGDAMLKQLQAAGATSKEVVGALNELNGTSGVEFDEAYRTYMGI